VLADALVLVAAAQLLQPLLELGLPRRLELGAQNAFDVDEHLVGRLVALGWRQPHRARDDALHRLAEALLGLARRRVLALLDLEELLEIRGRLERQPLGHHAVEHRTDGEDVGPLVERRARGLLGRHVRDLALDDARRSLLALALRLGDAEVAQLDLALLADEDVVGAEVAVNDAQGLPAPRLGVRIGQRAAHDGDDVQREGGREDHARSVRALEDLLQVPPVDQLHHQEVAFARDAQVEHLHDVAVLEAHRDVPLVQQHVAELRVGRELREDALEDDVLLETLGAVLRREEDLGHASVGELAENGVAAVTRHQRPVRYHGRVENRPFAPPP
jgi:hypothetical protein